MGDGPSRRRGWGLGGKTRWREIKLNLQRGSDGGEGRILQRNSGRGKGNDVLSATEGNTASRGRGGSVDLGLSDRMQAREARVAKRERIRCFSLVA